MSRRGTPNGYVAFAVSTEFAWVAVHVQAVAALGLVEGDPYFYLAYQIGRCTVAATAIAVALRSGLFGRRELGHATWPRGQGRRAPRQGPKSPRSGPVAVDRVPRIAPRTG